MIDKLKPYLKSKIMIGIAAFFMLIILLELLFPLPMQKPYSKEILARDSTLLTAYLSTDDKWRLHTSLDEISPDLIKAIIEKEDKWFFWHPGVNLFAVVRAFYSNIVSGEVVSGASTITMQVARLLEPAKRTYLSKFLEMLRAFQIELHYSKKEILEMYLSMLPYGGNIEGVKAASYIYFNRPPGNLSLAQSVLLAVIPNDPNSLRVDKSIDDAVKQRNVWLRRFGEDEVFPITDITEAIEESLTPNRYAMPVTAPHFSAYMNTNFKDDIVYSTLDLSKQRTAEKLLLNHVRRVTGKGVSNGAAIVIDNLNSNVVAYCGSADFYDDKISGQVNGITAVRSPGSTLKPALYAHAFDSGLLTPKMRLLDIPTDIGGYEPENYDQIFHGSVTAEFALVNSLNVPAVRLLEQVGFNQFLDVLTRGGLQTIADHQYQLGLSVILGGCGVKLQELADFYTTFARKGKLLPLRFTIDDADEDSGINVFTPGASYLIATILSNNERPDFPNILLNSTKLPRIAWKTGTSYGKRDAWAIGISPRYTIGVWMGNFDGKGSPHLSGAEMAVPLLFDLFNSIDYDSDTRWFGPSYEYDVLRRDVCAETGLLPSDNCANITQDYYIENISHNKRCDLNRVAYVNDNETIEYCTECLPDSGYKKIVYPSYEPELTLWYIRNNVQIKRPPPHNPKCSARFSGKGPKIISPSPDYEYFIEEDNPQQILLQAASDASVKTHYWFINDKFYKKCDPSEKIFFSPAKGEIKISCMDDRGRENTISINVKSY